MVLMYTAYVRTAICMYVCCTACMCTVGHVHVLWDMYVCFGTCVYALGHVRVLWDIWDMYVSGMCFKLLSVVFALLLMSLCALHHCE